MVADEPSEALLDARDEMDSNEPDEVKLSEFETGLDEPESDETAEPETAELETAG